MRPVLSVALAGLLVLAGTTVASNPDETTTKTTTPSSSSSLDFGIFDWVRSAPNGFYHPHQEFRKDPNTGVTGVFATHDIPEGTLLVSVPWSHIMDSDDPEEEGQLCCGTVARLKREWAMGNRSQFAPYIEYLQANYHRTKIPSQWSTTGRALLQAIVGVDPEKDGQSLLPPEGPFKWLEQEWYGRCGGSPADKLGIQAAFVVIQRSDDQFLIPGYDMYNHRNGKWLNTETIVSVGEDHETFATRDILAGEQVYITYNMCPFCVGRRFFYATGEILRDYGFVERMPQRFYYIFDQMKVHFNVDYRDDDDDTGNDDETSMLELEWDEDMGPPDDPFQMARLAGFFRRQIRRLVRLRNIDYRQGKPSKMPQSEWDVAWEFQQANIRAMTLAVESLEETLEQLRSSFAGSTAIVTNNNDSHYDALDDEVDDLSYQDETCDNEDALQHIHHKLVDGQGTYYQEMNFLIEPQTRDVVMELDDITQIASVYRPQYHEYSVHAAARFLDSVKRVIFIGGGDSMLLHEVLKYPELELMVGLELDQTVTRKSFKYFQTQPHFDDPRVEWWFGDATKSLLLLPKEYWQSFDLVLVDLSETVMSFSVTKELDVFDALALLLKPEGILVKNEVYMEQISKVFDYTVQICYQSPVICDQVLTFGSNKVDFMHAPVKDHGVETLLYTPLVTTENRHEFLHDYRQNNARAQGKCSIGDSLPELSAEQTKSAGIMEIVEAEQTTVPLNESLVSVLEKVIANLGFTLNSKTVYKKRFMLLLMKEGYVMVRMFPGKKYCNMDINLWGSFHKLKSLSTSLTEAVGAQVVSNYRVVVGGMYGSATWNDDQNWIGPQIVQNRDCSEPDSSKMIDTADGPSAETLISAALEESLETLYDGTDALAIVFCPAGDDASCVAADELSKSAKISKVVRLSTCAGLDAAEVKTMYDCEISLLAEWKQAVAAGKSKIVAIDAKVPFEMLQVVNSILDDDETRGFLISKRNLMMAWTYQPHEEPWRRNFLDRYRKQHMSDPISRAGFSMRSSGGVPMEFGIVSAGDSAIVYHLAAVEQKLQSRFPSSDGRLNVIHGGKYARWDPWEPKEFLPSDYDNSRALDQYFSQQPIAQHAIFQFEPTEGSDYKISRRTLNKALELSLRQVDFDCPSRFVVDNVGDGYILVCMDPNYGTVLLTWDGRRHVDISYYFEGDDEVELERFRHVFGVHTNQQLEIALRDDMPRGTGRIVSYSDDIWTVEERERFYESLLHEDYDYRAPKHQERVFGKVEKVEEGTCSIPGADSATCWPEPPPL